MIRFALRLHVNGILGYAAFFAVFAVVEVVSFGSLAAGSADRATLAGTLQMLGRQTSYMADPPHRTDLLAGYLQWFLVGFMGIFYSVWALLAGTGAIRQDEERGLIESWFATGVTPVQLVFTRLVAFGLAAAASVALILAWTLLLARATGQDLPAAATFEQAAIQLGPPLAAFSLGMFLAQIFPTRRNALGAGGLILLGLFLLNGFSRSVEWLRPFRWISPFSYPDRSHAMTPGDGVDLAAAAVPYLVAVAAAAVAAYLHSRRDLGAAYLHLGLGQADRPPRRTASTNPLLHVPALNVLWEQRVGLAIWSAGVVLYALVDVPLARPFNDFFRGGSAQSILQAKAAFGYGERDPVVGFVSSEWFQVACLMLAAYAITQVARWASDDAEGRLEMILSTGMPRWRVVAERAAGLLAAGALLALANTAGVMAGAALGGIKLELDSVLGASLLMLPVPLAFAAAGAGIAAVRPRAATTILIGVAAVGYLIPLMGVPIFHRVPPAWFSDLSVFHLYGSPLLDGVYWPGMTILLTAVAAGFSLSLVAMQRRNVGA